MNALLKRRTVGGDRIEPGDSPHTLSYLEPFASAVKRNDPEDPFVFGSASLRHHRCGDPNQAIRVGGQKKHDAPRRGPFSSGMGSGDKAVVSIGCANEAFVYRRRSAPATPARIELREPRAATPRPSVGVGRINVWVACVALGRFAAVHRGVSATRAGELAQQVRDGRAQILVGVPRPAHPLIELSADPLRRRETT